MTASYKTGRLRRIPVDLLFSMHAMYNVRRSSRTAATVQLWVLIADSLKSYGSLDEGTHFISSASCNVFVMKKYLASRLEYSL